MDKLLAYLNALNPDAQTDFAARCGTSLGYLRKACSVGQRLGESICIKVERESGGLIRCEMLRPDVDWAYLRNSGPTLDGAKAIQVQDAIGDVTEEATAMILHVADTAEAVLKRMGEALLAQKAAAAEPWDGVTERRHPDAPDHINGNGI